jgi:hypothetical protein
MRLKPEVTDTCMYRLGYRELTGIGIAKSSTATSKTDLTTITVIMAPKHVTVAYHSNRKQRFFLSLSRNQQSEY